jgi:hypothetical protein
MELLGCTPSEPEIHQDKIEKMATSPWGLRSEGNCFRWLSLGKRYPSRLEPLASGSYIRKASLWYFTRVEAKLLTERSLYTVARESSPSHV